MVFYDASHYHVRGVSRTTTRVQYMETAVAMMSTQLCHPADFLAIRQLFRKVMPLSRSPRLIRVYQPIADKADTTEHH